MDNCFTYTSVKIANLEALRQNKGDCSAIMTLNNVCRQDLQWWIDLRGDIKRRKSLPKKLRPTPMKGLKEIDSPKTQTNKKNYDPPQRQNSETVDYK